MLDHPTSPPAAALLTCPSFVPGPGLLPCILGSIEPLMGQPWGVLLAVAGLGLLAGVLGGLLGVGGSVLMIPGLTLLLGPSQHLYQASAMIVNVAVAIPAARRHHQAGATLGSVLRWMLPAGVGLVIVGVWASNLAPGLWLSRLMALFLVYVVAVNVLRLWRSLRQPAPGSATPTQADTSDEESLEAARIDPLRCGAVGSGMGLLAGLMGVGGGALAVPMQQALLGLPLRNAIANSSAVMCSVAAVGAIYKNATLGEHGEDWRVSLLLAGVLGGGAFVGGHIGAGLTHRLDLKWVRLAFLCLMIVACWRMARWGEGW